MLLSLTSCARLGPSTPGNPNTTPGTTTPSTPGTPTTPTNPPDPTPTPPSTGETGGPSEPTDPPGPNEQALNASITNISTPALSTTTTVEQVPDSDGAATQVRTSRIDYDADNLQEEHVDLSTGNAIEKLFHKRNGGGASQVSIDAKNNTAVETPLSSPTAWSDFGWIKDKFVHSEWVSSDGGNTYVYKGSTPAEIVSSLSRIELSDLPGASSVESLSLTLDPAENRVDKVEATTNSFPATGGTARYKFTIGIETTPRPITTPVPPPDPTLESASVFGSLVGNASYTASTTNTLGSEKSTTIVNPEIVYVKREGTVNSESGWYKAAKGWVSFTIANDQANLDANTLTASPAVKDWIGLNFVVFGSFVFNATNTEELSPAPYVTNVAENLPFKLSAPDAIADHSVLVKQSGNKINEISYDIVSSGNKGKETVKIVHDATAAKPEERVMTLLKNKEAEAIPTHTSWTDESALVQARLQGIFTDDAIISTLPYLYKKEIAGQWQATPNTGFEGYEKTVSLNPPAGLTSQALATEYKALLQSKGYTLLSGTDNVYLNNNVKIEINPSAVTQFKPTWFSLGFEEITVPKSWKEENPSIYNELTALYDNNAATVDQIPYFYAYELAGKWQGQPLGNQVRLVVPEATYDATAFTSGYVKLLTDAGFTREGTSGNVYVKADLGVKVEIVTTTSARALTFSKHESSIPPNPNPPVLPTSWRGETSVWQPLVDEFTEAVASTLPYLPLEGISTTWTGDRTPGLGVNLNAASGTDATAFYNAYKQLLTDSQYVETPANSNTFVKGEVSITISPTAVAIKFQKVESTTPPTPPTPPSSNLPTSWQADNPLIHNELEAIWGSAASTIPYLGWEGVSKNWTITLKASDTGNLAVRIETNADEALAREYYSKYGEHIINNGGYTALGYGQGYRKGNIGIKFNVDDVGDILINGKIIVTFQNMGG